MQETRLWSLGSEDPPEKGMASHSTVLAWTWGDWTEETGGLQFMGLDKELDMNERLNTTTMYYHQPQ